MQRSPDSALQTLLSFRAERGTSFEFNDNYQSLLISEALYKTDNAQLNRYRNETFQETSLQDAIHCFDSLAVQYPDNDDFTLLSARSHYMNGVGFYENDSMVEACKEYLHTLEIMENHFDEKELVGYKAKFMGLIYTRLGEICYYNVIAKAAIESYQKALYYFNKVSDYSLANTYRHIAGSYYLEHQNDSALFYYRKALNLAKTHNKVAIYGVTLAESTPVYYDLGYKDSAFIMIKKALLLSANEDQRLARCFTMGCLYEQEGMFDTAIIYFKQSLLREDYYTHTASEEKLIECYHFLGDSINEQYYKLQNNNSLQQFVERAPLRIEINTLYENYKLHIVELTHINHIREKQHKYIFLLSGMTLIIILILIISICRHKIKNKRLSIVEQKIAADTFENEPICLDIITIVNENHFKSQMDYVLYAKCSLGIEKISSLRKAVDNHYNQLTVYLKNNYQELTNDDIDYCCLYLLGLKDADVSALMQRSYRAVCDRNKKLRMIFKTNLSVCTFLKNIINERIIH